VRQRRSGQSKFKNKNFSSTTPSVRFLPWRTWATF